MKLKKVTEHLSYEFEPAPIEWNGQLYYIYDKTGPIDARTLPEGETWQLVIENLLDG
ncbi:MAG: hypothetical protein QGH83_00080 [Candidatus Pacebacteria bacterium]|nr:hypothetical protein [Candidatus Paceibacterota bacterium]